MLLLSLLFFCRYFVAINSNSFHILCASNILNGVILGHKYNKIGCIIWEARICTKLNWHGLTSSSNSVFLCYFVGFVLSNSSSLNSATMSNYSISVSKQSVFMRDREKKPTRMKILCRVALAGKFEWEWGWGWNTRIG